MPLVIESNTIAVISAARWIATPAWTQAIESVTASSSGVMTIEK